MGKIYNMLEERKLKIPTFVQKKFKIILINNQYGELVSSLTSCSSLQQQGAILRSKYHRKQQRKMFSKSRCCEP
jgi:hypothetical protein